jgi:hypothetical protein
MIKIICVNNDFYPLSLHLNKEYEAKEEGFFYIILDETLEEYYYPKELFKLKDVE